MSTDNQILSLSFPAAEDLTEDQYKFVVLTATNTVRRPDSEVEVALGILQNAPALGEAASVMIIGESKFQCNAALGAGAFIMPEYVSAADAGKAKTAAAALQYARAIVIEPTSDEDDLGSCLLIGPVPAITATAWQRAVVTTDATAGARTYTAAELIGGLILRDPAGGNRNDVTPTAALIVAGIAGAVVGSSFEFTIRNTADAAETLTITAGTDVTLSGTMTVAQNNSKRFMAVVTNAASGSEAVTIYSLGTVVH
jgi:hypothetical protein